MKISIMGDNIFDEPKKKKFKSDHDFLFLSECQPQDCLLSKKCNPNLTLFEIFGKIDWIEDNMPDIDENEIFAPEVKKSEENISVREINMNKIEEFKKNNKVKAMENLLPYDTYLISFRKGLDNMVHECENFSHSRSDEKFQKYECSLPPIPESKIANSCKTRSCQPKSSIFEIFENADRIHSDDVISDSTQVWKPVELLERKETKKEELISNGTIKNSFCDQPNAVPFKKFSEMSLNKFQNFQDMLSEVSFSKSSITEEQLAITENSEFLTFYQCCSSSEENEDLESLCSTDCEKYSLPFRKARSHTRNIRNASKVTSTDRIVPVKSVYNLDTMCLHPRTFCQKLFCEDECSSQTIRHSLQTLDYLVEIFSDDERSINNHFHFSCNSCLMDRWITLDMLPSKKILTALLHNFTQQSKTDLQIFCSYSVLVKYLRFKSVRNFVLYEFFQQQLDCLLSRWSRLGNSRCSDFCSSSQCCSDSLILELFHDAIEIDLQYENCTSQQVLCKQDVYLYLSPDNNFSVVQTLLKLIVWLFGIHTELPLCSSSQKLLQILQRFIATLVNVSIFPEQIASRVAEELMFIYFQLNCWRGRQLLMETLSSPLVRLKFCQVILEKISCLEDSFKSIGSLQDIVGFFLQLDPRRDILMAPLSLDVFDLGNSDVTDGSRSFTSQNCEELTMLLYWSILSYILVKTGLLDRPIWEQSSADSSNHSHLSHLDLLLLADISNKIAELEMHFLNALEGELTMKTVVYFTKLCCLVDLNEVQLRTIGAAVNKCSVAY